MVYVYTARHKKHTKIYRLYLEAELSNSNNFWYAYSRHNWPSQDQLCLHLTKRLFLHYLRKIEQAKYCIFIQYSIIV